MKLQNPPSEYMKGREVERNRALEQADNENHKRNRDIEVGAGRLILTDDITNARFEVYVSSGSIGVRAL